MTIGICEIQPEQSRLESGYDRDAIEIMICVKYMYLDTRASTNVTYTTHTSLLDFQDKSNGRIRFCWRREMQSAVSFTIPNYR